VTAVVEAIDLHRTYRTTTGTFRRRSLEVEAVRGVSFEIGEGELFGLLGPNGAGKTTTIKMLITLLLPTSGQARVLGHDVVEDAHWVRKRIGYVFGGDRGLYERLSALDNLRYFAELYGVDPHVQRMRIAELLELVGLDGREKERVEGYSRGMRQRLHIARGLLHDPAVVFLDEPTIGVDPVGARELRSMIAGLKAAGRRSARSTASPRWRSRTRSRPRSSWCRPAPAGSRRRRSSRASTASRSAASRPASRPWRMRTWRS
jgi:ABC-2 type transport system ATP-binding protein